MSRRPPVPRARAASGARAAAPRPAPAPGRTPAQRAAARPASAPPRGAPPVRTPAPAVERVVRGGAGGELARLLSVRALLLGVVLLIGFAMVFPTVRAYLAQRALLTSLQAQVAAAEAREDRLRTDLGRWQVDAYVVAQARERLSYVMPGEKAYRVIDPQSVTEPSQVVASAPGADGGVALPVGGASAPWYATVWQSVQLAGEAPVPGEHKEGTEPAGTDPAGTDPAGTDPAAPTTPGAGG